MPGSNGGDRGLGLGAGTGSMNAFIPAGRKKRVISKHRVKTQHRQDPSSGQGIVLDVGKISTKQEGCHSTSAKN